MAEKLQLHFQRQRKGIERMDPLIKNYQRGTGSVSSSMEKILEMKNRLNTKKMNPVISLLRLHQQAEKIQFPFIQSKEMLHIQSSAEKKNSHWRNMPMSLPISKSSTKPDTEEDSFENGMIIQPLMPKGQKELLQNLDTSDFEKRIAEAKARRNSEKKNEGPKLSSTGRVFSSTHEISAYTPNKNSISPSETGKGNNSENHSPTVIQREFQPTSKNSKENRAQKVSEQFNSAVKIDLDERNAAESSYKDLNSGNVQSKSTVSRAENIQKIPEKPEINPVFNAGNIQRIPEEQEINAVSNAENVQKIPEKSEVKAVSNVENIQKIPEKSEVKAASSAENIQSFPEKSIANAVPGTENIQRIPEKPETNAASGTEKIQRIPEKPAANAALGTEKIQRIPEKPAANAAPGTEKIQRIPEKPEANAAPGTEKIQRIPEKPETNAVPGTEKIQRIPEKPETNAVLGTEKIQRIPEKPEAKAVLGAEKIQRIPEKPETNAAPDTENIQRIPEKLEAHADSRTKNIQKIPEVSRESRSENSAHKTSHIIGYIGMEKAEPLENFHDLPSEAIEKSQIIQRQPDEVQSGKQQLSEESPQETVSKEQTSLKKADLWNRSQLSGRQTEGKKTAVPKAKIVQLKNQKAEKIPLVPSALALNGTKIQAEAVKDAKNSDISEQSEYRTGKPEYLKNNQKKIAQAAPVLSSVPEFTQEKIMPLSEKNLQQNYSQKVVQREPENRTLSKNPAENIKENFSVDNLQDVPKINRLAIPVREAESSAKTDFSLQNGHNQNKMSELTPKENIISQESHQSIPVIKQAVPVAAEESPVKMSYPVSHPHSQQPAGSTSKAENKNVLTKSDSAPQIQREAEKIVPKTQAAPVQSSNNPITKEQKTIPVDTKKSSSEKTVNEVKPVKADLSDEELNEIAEQVLPRIKRAIEIESRRASYF